jgi:hypothetical protein
MMHATIRRYESVDQNGTDELKRKINETLIPQLSKLPGFNGYWVIETDKDVFTSFSLFGTPAEAQESSRIAANWVRDEKLERTLPNPPVVTGGEVIAHKSNGMVRA